MKANLTGFGLQRRLPLFLTLPSPHAPTGALCEDGCSLSKRLHADQTSNHCADVAEPTCSASKAPHPNLMKVAAALIHWSWPSAPHHGETRLCIFLPFHISFIANIARKRPELKRDKTNFALPHFRTKGATVHVDTAGDITADRHQTGVNKGIRTRT
jgi:hypothetical protein